MSDATSENQGPRLRTACDACQSYKVKCSRAKPSCWRCAENGTPCVYSPWRKTGRPPKHASKGSRDVGGGKNTDIHPGQDEGRGRQAKLRTQKPSSHQPSASLISHPTTRGPLVTGQQENDGLTHKPQRTFPEVQLSSTSAGRMENITVTSDSTTRSENFSIVAQDPMLDFSGYDFSMDMLIPEFDMALESTDLLPMLGLETADNHDIDNLTSVEPCVIPPFSQTLSANNNQALESIDSGTARNQYLLPLTSSSSSSDLLTIDSSANNLQSSSSSSLDTSRTSSSRPTSKEAPAVLLSTKEPIDERSPQERNRLSLEPVNPPPSVRSYSVSSVEKNNEWNPRPQGCSCYHLLSLLLGKVGGYDSDGNNQGRLSLDALLDLDRELQDMVSNVLHCRRCMEKSPNQNIFMLIYMALDGLLHAFESYHLMNRQAVTTLDGSPAMEPIVNSFHTSTFVSQSSKRVYSPNSWRHHGRHIQPQCSLKVELDTSRNWLKFPLCEEPLFVGNYMVDDAVKADFLCHLLCDLVGNLTELLSKLDRESACILTGVNGRIAKTKAEDIHRRAIFLRGRLRLGC